MKNTTDSEKNIPINKMKSLRCDANDQFNSRTVIFLSQKILAIGDKNNRFGIPEKGLPKFQEKTHI